MSSPLSFRNPPFPLASQILRAPLLNLLFSVLLDGLQQAAPCKPQKDQEGSKCAELAVYRSMLGLLQVMVDRRLARLRGALCHCDIRNEHHNTMRQGGVQVKRAAPQAAHKRHSAFELITNTPWNARSRLECWHAALSARVFSVPL